MCLYPEINLSHVGEVTIGAKLDVRSSVIMLHHTNIAVKITIMLEHVATHLQNDLKIVSFIVIVII